MNFVTVKTYTYTHKAHLDELTLKNEGIPVFLKDELTNQVDNFMSYAIGGVKLQVPEEYYEQAYNLIHSSTEIQNQREEKHKPGYIRNFLKIALRIPIIRHLPPEKQLFSVLVFLVTVVVILCSFLYLVFV
ncbi:MAG: hypothetical protein R6U95_02620 [Bacteroidales bacterium]